MTSLPLFPLGGVLLPGGRMPLQLFEPRYLALAQRLADEPDGGRRFGVVLIRQGHEVGPDAVTDLHGVGCEAVVDAMALAKGRSGTVVHLVGRGVRRFRLDGLDPEAGTPYLTGEVGWLEDGAHDDPEVEALARKALAAHERYLRTVGAEAETVGAEAEPVDAVASDVAYRVAERMVLESRDRQRVLEGADAATRLRTVLALLSRETAIVGRLGAVPKPPDLGGAALN
ncbi:LON peptidase substrate-binding domain-containing protein [Phycicoccus sp. CSK15P-2]|uniref:LON peptidase substrate-binding domain-containing protein n=1 Tax=Phycicoccus sp. CSK15P-2 TaxID=2807627 RepID=UPI0019528F6B|nr:LON peptidase substrate-binding domain-containing protein [Phycicoccus sp. CSK15P-2]MBM6405845.1 LON peptidase substrate-binding domain-containing protein [Phycicoccus sp. CSK15P-2]